MQLRCNSAYTSLSAAPSGEDELPLELPEPQTVELPLSPLSLVVCQIRHENTVSVSDPRRAVAVHEAVVADYPVLEEQSTQELEITAGPAGVQTVPSHSSRGWRMRSKDGNWTAVLMPEFFALETTGYRDWEDFSARVERFSKAVITSVEPTLEQRVGLRFINRITHPEVELLTDWRRFIDGPFLGAVSHDGLAPAIATSQHVMQLDIPQGPNVLLRYGCFRDAEAGNQWVYMFDQDCFIQRGQLLELPSLLAATEDLHTLALQLFQEAITDEMYEYLLGTKT